MSAQLAQGLVPLLRVVWFFVQLQADRWKNNQEPAQFATLSQRTQKPLLTRSQSDRHERLRRLRRCAASGFAAPRGMRPAMRSLT